MEPTSLDALAERIARIGRRDAATAIASTAAPEQLQRITGLLDQAVMRMSQEIAAAESRNAEAVTRAEVRAAKAIDSVAIWLEKRDARDTEQDRRLEQRDQLFARNLALLTSRLEEIDARLSGQSGPAAAPLRETVQTIERQLDRVSRAAPPQSDAGSEAMLGILRDLDRRMQEVTARLDQDQRVPRLQACDQKEAIGRLETQLAEILGAVKGNGGSPSPSRASAALRDRDLVSAIDEIAARQRALDAEDVPVSVKQLDRTEAALGDLKREIGTLASRFTDPAATVASRNDVRAQIMAISHALHDLAPRRQVQNVELALRDLSDKIESSRSEGTREALLAPIERLLGDIRLNLETFRDTDGLAQINARLESLQQQIEDGRRNGTDPRAIESLTRQLADIRALLSESGSGPALAAIEHRLAAIGERLDIVAERSPARERDPDIAKAISEIRSLLDRADPARAIAEAEAKLSAQMQEHSRAMEARFVAREQANPPGPSVTSIVDGLASRLDQIQQSLAQQGDQQDFDRIARQVAMLEEKIDTLPQREDNSGAVVEMVRHLAAKLDTVEQRMPDVLGLAEIVHKLADQVEASLAASGAAPGDTSGLERQIASIASRLDRPIDGAAALPALERAVNELFGQIETMKLSGAQTAAAAAREAVQATLADIAPENFMAAANEGVAALTHEIQYLRSAQSEADQRHQLTLDQVHDTLGKIVDRLAMLETDIAESRQAVPAFEPQRVETIPAASEMRFTPPAPEAGPVFSRVVDNEPANPPASEPQGQTSLVSSMRQMLARSSKTETARAEPPAPPPASAAQRNVSFLDSQPAMHAPPSDEIDADLPLEPGTGSPKRSIADELAQSLEQAIAPAPAPGESARNDFLKLARQAMSGSSAGAMADEAGKGQKKAKPARTDRISTLELSGTAKASSARKVVPLLGAAAVVAVAGIGGALWLRMPAGEGQPLQTNSIGPQLEQQPQIPEQGLPALPETAIAPSAAPVMPEVDAQAPAAQRPQPRRVDTTSSTNPAAPTAPNAAKAIGPDAFAQWPADAQANADIAEKLAARITALAETGDAAAQYDLGVRLTEGRGMERDAKEGLKWLEKAANKGLAPAQFRVGSIFREGKGVTADNAKAMEWFKRAAQRGHARAMHNLAVVLAEGVKGAPDYAAAGEWFRKAAEFGIKDSQFNVAILYARGLGLPQDLGEAYKWFNAAAVQGDEDAGKKRDEVAARLDARRLALAKSEAEAFKAKPLDPGANDVVVPSYGAAEETKAKGKKV